MSKKLKAFQELTICDNFLFGTVMLDEELCCHMIELAVGFPIASVSVVREKSMQFHPEYRGIRLDVYAKDERNTHYDVEMQIRRENFLEKRTRYYHDQMDMELLETGISYEELPDCYVIFICCFDPFGYGKYRYTVSDHCMETGQPVPNGAKTIYLSTKGYKEAGEAKELIDFLGYVESCLNPQKEYHRNLFIDRLEERIRQIKSSREARGNYMLFDITMERERKEARREGHEEGRAEGRAEGLSEGRVGMLQELICSRLRAMDCFSEELKNAVCAEKSEETLMAWYQKVLGEENKDQK